jgi:hypothetical protein
VDWNSDAAFITAFLLFPEQFTPEDLRAGANRTLCHVPSHLLAAARLAGHETKDISPSQERTWTSQRSLRRRSENARSKRLQQETA